MIDELGVKKHTAKIVVSPFAIHLAVMLRTHMSVPLLLNCGYLKINTRSFDGTKVTEQLRARWEHRTRKNVIMYARSTGG